MVIWIGEIALVWAALFAVQIPLRSKSHPALRTIVYCVKLAFIPLVALCFVALDSTIPYMRGDLFCAVYIVLIGVSFVLGIALAAAGAAGLAAGMLAGSAMIVALGVRVLSGITTASVIALGAGAAE